MMMMHLFLLCPALSSRGCNKKHRRNEGVFRIPKGGQAADTFLCSDTHARHPMG